MTISVLLRLAPDALEQGRLAGHVELVETGARGVVRDAAELVAFLRQAGSHAVEPTFVVIDPPDVTAEIIATAKSGA